MTDPAQRHRFYGPDLGKSFYRWLLVWIVLTIVAIYAIETFALARLEGQAVVGTLVVEMVLVLVWRGWFEKGPPSGSSPAV